MDKKGKCEEEKPLVLVHGPTPPPPLTTGQFPEPLVNKQLQPSTVKETNESHLNTKRAKIAVPVPSANPFDQLATTNSITASTTTSSTSTSSSSSSSAAAAAATSSSSRRRRRRGTFSDYYVTKRKKREAGKSSTSTSTSSAAAAAATSSSRSRSRSTPATAASSHHQSNSNTAAAVAAATTTAATSEGMDVDDDASYAPQVARKRPRQELCTIGPARKRAKIVNPFEMFYKRLATTNISEVARKRPWQELRTVGATTESIIR